MDLTSPSLSGLAAAVKHADSGLGLAEPASHASARAASFSRSRLFPAFHRCGSSVSVSRSRVVGSRVSTY